MPATPPDARQLITTSDSSPATQFSIDKPRLENFHAVDDERFGESGVEQSEGNGSATSLPGALDPNGRRKKPTVVVRKKSIASKVMPSSILARPSLSAHSPKGNDRAVRVPSRPLRLPSPGSTGSPKHGTVGESSTAPLAPTGDYQLPRPKVKAPRKQRVKAALPATVSNHQAASALTLAAPIASTSDLSQPINQPIAALSIAQEGLRLGAPPVSTVKGPERESKKRKKAVSKKAFEAPMIPYIFRDEQKAIGGEEGNEAREMEISERQRGIDP
jgi:hypothetical protein